MLKPIIITGLEASGKSFLAANLSLMYNHPKYIHCKGKPFFKSFRESSSLNIDMDLIVFDDLEDILMIKELIIKDQLRFTVLKEGTYVIKKPQIIITCKPHELKLSEILISKVIILETSFKNGVFCFSKKKY